MKKIFKKLMVVVLAVAVSAVGGRTEVAEAAGHVHDEVMVILTASEGGYLHQVPLYDTRIDPWGNPVLALHSYIYCPVG